MDLCDETYRRKKKQLYKSNEKRREEELKDKVVVEWWGNYNRSWGHPFYNISKSCYKAFNWTVKGKIIKNTKISLSCIRLQNEILHCHTKQWLFSSSDVILNYFKCFKCENAMSRIDKINWSSINNILDIFIDDNKENPQKSYKKATNSFSNFIPWMICKENVGETEGLVNLLTALQDSIKNSSLEYYKLFLFDQNIYWITLKVSISLYFFLDK